MMGKAFTFIFVLFHINNKPDKVMILIMVYHLLQNSNKITGNRWRNREVLLLFPAPDILLLPEILENIR